VASGVKHLDEPESRRRRRRSERPADHRRHIPVQDEMITEIEVLADPARPRELDIAVIEDDPQTPESVERRGIMPRRHFGRTEPTTGIRLSNAAPARGVPAAGATGSLLPPAYGGEADRMAEN
jgi:hypothetical protein